MKRNNGIVVEIIILCILAFGIRLFLLDTNALPYPDAMHYLTLGYNFIRGNFNEGISWLWPMLYPVFVGFFSLFIKDLVLAGYITSITFGSLLVIPCYLLACDIFGKRAARYTGLFIILYPFLIRWSNEAITDMTYTFFFMCIVYFCWKAISDNNTKNYIALGVSAGLCYLTRPTGLFAFILSVAVLVFVMNRKNLNIIGKYILVLFLTFGIFAVPYIIFERVYTGHWTFSMYAKYTLIYSKQRTYLGGKSDERRWLSGLYPDKSSNVIDEFYNSRGYPAKKPVIPTIDKIPISKQIKGFLKHVFQFYKILIPEIFPGIILILASLGFGKEVFRNQKIPNIHLFLLVFAIGPILQYFYCYIRDRYFLTMVPIAIIFSGEGLSSLCKAIRNGIIRFIIIFAVIGLLVLDIPSLRGKLNVIREAKKPVSTQKILGTWLQENYPNSNLCLMAGYPGIALYAPANRFVDLPTDNLEEVIEYAKLKKVDFIIIGEGDVLVNKRKGLISILDPQNAPKDLELVYQDKDNSCHWGKILVYKLKRRLRKSSDFELDAF